MIWRRLVTPLGGWNGVDAELWRRAAGGNTAEQESTVGA